MIRHLYGSGRALLSAALLTACLGASLWSAAAAAAINGYHDDANGSGASGWVCDTSNYAATVSVSLYRSTSFSLSDPGAQGAQFLGSVSANGYRGDLAQVCSNQLNHAFSISWPTWAYDGLGYYVYAVGQPVGGGAGVKLVNSPLYITFPAPTNQVPNGAQDDLWATGQTVKVRGWACDPDANSQSLNIYVYAATWNMPDPIAGGAALVTSGTANLTRSDVGGVCGGTTQHGFELTLPEQLNTGVPRYIYTYVLDANTPNLLVRLSNTPLGITFPSPPVQNRVPAGALEDLYPVGQTVYTTGWSCDLDVPLQALTVEIWSGTWAMPDPIGGGAQLLGTTTAGIARADLAVACAGSTTHAFQFTLPSSCKWRT